MSKSRPGRKGATFERHALLAPTVMNLFQILDIGLTLWVPGRWREIYERDPAHEVLGFEMSHGVEAERVAYNSRCLEQARSKRESVLATHAGLSDLFVPVVSDGRVQGVLVSGPFATSRPSAAELLERWRTLSGRQGDPADPEFSHYLEVSLSVLVLEGTATPDFRELLEQLAQLLVLEGAADERLSRIEELGKKLVSARLVERTWRIAHALCDERTSRGWTSPNRRVRLFHVGLERCPEAVVVGLFVNRAAGADPVDELLRRDAFQRACCELARQSKGTVSGRVGGHGVSFLATKRGSAERTLRHLLEVANQAATLARRKFGLELHLGLGEPARPLAEQYQSALSGAEAALSSGKRQQEANGASRRSSAVGSLRRELGQLAEREPSALPARFEHYLGRVSARSAHRLEVVRVELEAGFERIVEAAEQSGTLGAKALGTVCDEAARTAGEANTVSELAAVYRRSVADLSAALADPRAAERDRSLRRADDYIRQHYTEPLSLAQVARVVGFAPNYFSGLFHKQRGMTFEHYLMQLRVERARQLLSGTKLSLQRVAQLSGCSTRQYFGRLFKRLTGETPLQYRTRVRQGLFRDVKPMLPKSD